MSKTIIWFSLLLALAAPQTASATDVLELFLVSPASDGGLRYGRKTAELKAGSGDPDTVARALLEAHCQPALLHSTSWRWETDGTVVLTYLAFSEDPGCASAETQRLGANELLPPQATDPRKPRPAEIRERDVLAHGIRHLAFLLRYATDERIARSLSAESRRVLAGLCAQPAGRFETAATLSDCNDSRAGQAGNAPR